MLRYMQWQFLETDDKPWELYREYPIFRQTQMSRTSRLRTCDKVFINSWLCRNTQNQDIFMTCLRTQPLENLDHPLPSTIISPSLWGWFMYLSFIVILGMVQNLQFRWAFFLNTHHTLSYTKHQNHRNRLRDFFVLGQVVTVLEAAFFKAWVSPRQNCESRMRRRWLRLGQQLDSFPDGWVPIFPLKQT